jgi:hypothetical protein
MEGVGNAAELTASMKVCRWQFSPKLAGATPICCAKGLSKQDIGTLQAQRIR